MNKIKFPFTLGLSGKIVLIIEVFVVTFSLLVGIAAHYILYDVLKSDYYVNIKNILTIKEEAINFFIKDVKEEMSEVVENKEYHKLFVESLQDKKGRSIDMLSTLRNDLLEEKDYIIDLLLLNPKGVVISAQKEAEIGKSHAGSIYFKEGLKNIYFQSSYLDPLSLQHIMMLTYPIRNERGESVGVLVAKISRNEFKTISSSRIGLGKTGEIFFVDINHYVTTPLLKIKNAEHKTKISLFQVEQCLGGVSNSGERTDYNGDLVWGMWKWHPQTQSCMVVKFDKNEILAPMQTIRVVAEAGTLVIMLFTGIIGAIVAQETIKPLKKLQHNVCMVIEGKTDTIEKINTNDEVAELASTFAKMMQEIKSGREDLEIKVKERTIEANNTLLQMEQQNASLKEGRMAVLNILEDAQLLEKELKTEKEGVERKVEERTQELGEEKARLMAAISSLPQAFFILNKENEIVVYNNKVREILGETDGLWTLKKINEAMGNTFDLEKYVAEAVKEKKAPKEKEVMAGPKYLMVYTSPILPGMLSDSQEVIGSVVTLTDITEERLLERSRDEFFSIASHELRTPLTAIRGNTSVILDYYLKDIPNKDIQVMVTDIHSSSIHLISIVNDFLNMSRLEQKKMTYKQESVLLSKIMNQIIIELGVNAAEKGILIQNDVNKDIVVWADEGKVGQIFTNLVGNALKFTQKGIIAVSAHTGVDAVEIEFSDTGIGIPLVNQSLLFKKFQQAATSITTRETAQGTGLGLYISRLLAEGMGGTLTLKKSSEGKGSTFLLTLPTIIVKK